MFNGDGFLDKLFILGGPDYLLSGSPKATGGSPKASLKQALSVNILKLPPARSARPGNPIGITAMVGKRVVGRGYPG
jgi:hypothetical protein